MEKLFYMIYAVCPLIVAYWAIQYKNDIFSVIKNIVSEDRLGKTLLIGVLSARGHFEQRAVIRDTWWGHVKNNDSLYQRVDLKFVVGSNACPFHPDNREDELSCLRWSPTFPGNGSLYAIREHRVSSSKFKRNFPLQMLQFKVLYPVVLNKLGIHSSSITDQTVVQLLDASMQSEIVRAVFSKKSSGAVIEGFRYKAVEPYLLPKGFEGVIIAENHEGSKALLPVTQEGIATEYNRGGHVLLFQKGQMNQAPDGAYASPLSLKANLLNIVSFEYVVHEPEKLKEWIGDKSKVLSKDWKQKMALESDQLRREIEEHDDILQVNMIDTYRNLPHKLLKFFHWSKQENPAQYTLKTDDDCYIDVARILDGLQEEQADLWWGRFRQNWPVDRHGKWAELEYPSTIYPLFTCGSGYVLGHKLVDWLARNADQLKTYQGEDVSLGIWLSAIEAHRKDDALWQCDGDCLSEMYSMPESTPTMIKQAWKNQNTCHDPCGCGG